MATRTKQTAAQPFGFVVALLNRAGGHVIGGALLAAALLLGFAFLSEDVFSNETQRWDIALELAVHTWSSATLDDLFTVLTTLGSLWGTLGVSAIAVAILFWRRQRWAIGFLALAEAGGWALTDGLKVLFRRPRPELWPHTHDLTTFSYPSGHATVSLCVFGALVYIGYRIFPQRWQSIAWGVALAVLIGGIGLSRIYFGIHYPSDVLAGYLTGGVWLAALISAHIYIRHHTRTAASRSGCADRR